MADNLTVDANGNLNFWISIFPTTLTELTVTVDTDKASYRKTFSNISKTFTQNARNILGVNMADAVKTSNDLHYVKVTSALTDWTGDYLIVYEPDALVLDSDGDAKTHASVTIEDGKIAYESASAYNIHVQKSGSGYSMKMGDNYYGLDASKNALNVSTDEPTDDYYRWKFVFSQGITTIYNLGYSNRFLQYNAGSGQFRCYTSAQKDITLFRLDGEAGGGGVTPPPVTPSVTTGPSTDVTQTEATLSATYTGTPTYGGFEWGLSASDLSEDSQAAYLTNGSFQVKLDGLGAGHTYYYRAYIAVLENGTYKYYYGEVKSFTTPTGEIVIGGDQPGWCETPVMNIKKSGGYMVNSSNANEYYAIHMCAGGEKGPDGKTARNYTVCYSGKYHCPVWVAAPRHSMYVGNSGRTDAYRQDPDIPSNIQYNSKSTGGGCNKGHMLGSAERTSSAATNRDVFYYTNIAPQLSSGFNTGGGGWNILEDFVDTKVCADTLYEVLGCYFVLLRQVHRRLRVDCLPFHHQLWRTERRVDAHDVLLRPPPHQEGQLRQGAEELQGRRNDVRCLRPLAHQQPEGTESHRPRAHVRRRPRKDYRRHLLPERSKCSEGYLQGFRLGVVRFYQTVKKRGWPDWDHPLFVHAGSAYS